MLTAKKLNKMNGLFDIAPLFPSCEDEFPEFEPELELEIVGEFMKRVVVGVVALHKESY